MARPKTKIDWNKVDKLLQAQCVGTGIAEILGVHPDTLYRACQEDNKIGFAEYSANKKGEGLELLRAKQFQTAMAGDKTMQIWLGKQYLNQKDKTDTTSGDEPLKSDIHVIVDSSETAKLLKELRDGISKAD